MKLKLQQLPETVKGPGKKCLALDAAESLLRVETQMSSLVYKHTWLDPMSHLAHLVNEHPASSLKVGYSGHGYGMSVDVDLEASLKNGVTYESLLDVMRKNGWYCHRRDKLMQTYAGHFNFLGQLGTKYVIKANFDPSTWNVPVEERIYDLHGQDFQLEIPRVQEALRRLGLYYKTPSGELDLYTREAILAFQRCWNLPQSGQADAGLCRTLAFVTCDFEVLSA